jgi:hypothetical protein
MSTRLVMGDGTNRKVARSWIGMKPCYRAVRGEPLKLLTMAIFCQENAPSYLRVYVGLRWIALDEQQLLRNLFL